MYPLPQNQNKFFLSKVRFELANLPPTPWIRKNLLSKVRFVLANVPPPLSGSEKNLFIQS